MTVTNPFHAPNPFFASPVGSPFGSVEAGHPRAEPGTHGEGEYEIVASAPAPAAEEIETELDALEVRALFGRSVLKVAHLSPLRAFVLGDGEGKASCDLVVPADVLGLSAGGRTRLVDVSAGQATLAIVAGLEGKVTLPGGEVLALEALRAEGKTHVPLPRGSRADLRLGGVSIEIAAVKAGRKTAGRLSLDGRPLLHTALSAAAHLGLLGAMAAFVPSLGIGDDEELSESQAAVIQHALAIDALREHEKVETEEAEEAQGAAAAGEGARSVGDEGATGSTTSVAKNRAYAVKGQSSEVKLSRQAALAQAAEFGMAGLLHTMNAGGDPDAPTAAWGELASEGRDAFSARGNMWGAELGEAGGAGGLGLSGIGEGGGGKWLGVGLDSVGTIGHGSGCMPGARCDGMIGGFAGSSGRLAKGHRTKSPGGMREGVTQASGRLPPEVIQRVVRQNFGRFRLCYQNALRNNPNLEGRVAVRFVIGATGAVSSARNGGSDLPDSGAVSCVVSAFHGLSFPAPESGIVTVTYPIVFSPGA